MNIIRENSPLTLIFDTDNDVLLFNVVCSFKIVGF